MERGMENQRRATDSIWSPSLHKIRKVVVIKNEPVLYYLYGEYEPFHGFVQELMLIADPERVVVHLKAYCPYILHMLPYQ
jgi:hypothetical protein